MLKRVAASFALAALALAASVQCRGRRLSDAAGAHHRRLRAGLDRRLCRPRGGAEAQPRNSASSSWSRAGAGAGSNLAAEFVARAPKDGYTLLMGTVANTINASISKLSFDFAKDFAPIAPVSTVPNILVAHPSTGFRTVADLVACEGEARADDCTAPPASAARCMSMASCSMSSAGIKLTHVPYPGSAQSLTDLLAGTDFGDVLAGADGAAAYPVGRADGARGHAHSDVLPNLPSMADAGYQGFDAGLWFGMLAPAGTPREVIDKVSVGINEALKMDDVIAGVAQAGVRAARRHAGRVRRYVQSEIAQWARVAQSAGLKK